MLRFVGIALSVLLASGLLLRSADHSKASAATTETTGLAGTETGRFTTYRAPIGAELTVTQVQSGAVAFARRAGQLGTLMLTTAHSTFAHAHALMMGESLSEAQVAESDGPAERVEEMRSPVWITMITAASGQVFEPNNPVRRGHKAPSGKVVVVVADAHTGFIKEEYLGPTGPNISLLGPTATASVPAETAGSESHTAMASVRLNPKLGIINGRLAPARVGWPVSIANIRHRRLATEKSLPAGPETEAGSFSFRELEGNYVVSAPSCGSLRVIVHGRRETRVTLRCN
jgi:hypothetical protein